MFYLTGCGLWWKFKCFKSIDIKGYLIKSFVCKVTLVPNGLYLPWQATSNDPTDGHWPTAITYYVDPSKHCQNTMRNLKLTLTQDVVINLTVYYLTLVLNFRACIEGVRILVGHQLPYLKVRLKLRIVIW